jgi:hypothetical protein
LGDRQRVGDVGLTAVALLPLVGDLSDPVGPLDQSEIRPRVRALNGAQESVEAFTRRGFGK